MHGLHRHRLHRRRLRNTAPSPAPHAAPHNAPRALQALLRGEDLATAGREIRAKVLGIWAKAPPYWAPLDLINFSLVSSQWLGLGLGSGLGLGLGLGLGVGLGLGLGLGP